MKKLISLLFLFSLSSLALAESKSFPEPFGLTWGMSEADLIKVGFTRSGPVEDFNILSSVSAPKAWSKADDYMAVTYKGKLVKVIASSKPFTSDLYGSEAKASYSQIKSLLSKKYGEPKTSWERVGLDLYKDSDEFYQCLKYDGCGQYISLYEYAGGYISLQIKGVSRGKGYLMIGYESPEFYAAKNAIENQDSAADAEAF